MGSGKTVTAQQRGEPTVESCRRISDHHQRCFKAFRNSEELRTWPAADHWCRNQSDRYTLATVRDDDTQEALTSFLYDHELTSRNVWIGARSTTKSRWLWLDGTNESSESRGDLMLIGDMSP